MLRISRACAHVVIGLAGIAVFMPLAVGAQEVRWRLTETLRIGGGESGPASFTSIRSLDADAQGRVYVLERSTQDIRIFGPDGTYLRTIGRAGAGPGELRNAEGMMLARDGRIWVRDAANGRFTVFGTDGGGVDSWTVRFCWSQGNWHPQEDRQGRIIDHDCVVREGRGRESVVLAYNPDLTRVDTLAVRPECGSQALSEAGTWVRRTEKQTMYVAIPFAPFPAQSLGPAGETWCAPSSARYEILRIAAGARDTIRVARSIPLVPVTRRERDSVIARFDARGPSGFDYGRIPRTKPAILRILVDEQGRAWVRREDANRAVFFDVFASDGTLLATVELGLRRSPAFLPFVVRGNNLYTVVLDADDVQHVVRFAISAR